MEKGETTAEHTKIQREEAQRVETDKADTNPNTGGLFKGTFKSKPPTQQPVYDIEDNVLRCPLCSWELEEDSTCVQCGYRVTHEDGDRWSDPEDNSEMSDYFDEDVEDAFDAIDDFQGGQLNGAPPFRPLAPHLRERPYDLHGPWGFIDYQLSFPHGGPPIRNGRLPLHQDELESDSEDEEFDDTDMDSFIEDDMGGQQQYDSESDHSTVVGGDEPSTQDHYDDSQLGTVPSSDYASESIEGDASEDASDDEVDEVDEEDGINEEDEEGERGEILEEYDEEGDVEGDEGVPVQPSRQTLHYNVHAPRNTRPYYPPPRLQQRRQPPHSAGSSTVNAINIDDESDEGPIGPVRRTRGRRDCPL